MKTNFRKVFAPALFLIVVIVTETTSLDYSGEEECQCTRVKSCPDYGEGKIKPRRVSSYILNYKLEIS